MKSKDVLGKLDKAEAAKQQKTVQPSEESVVDRKHALVGAMNSLRFSKCHRAAGRVIGFSPLCRL